MFWRGLNPGNRLVSLWLVSLPSHSYSVLCKQGCLYIIYNGYPRPRLRATIHVAHRKVIFWFLICLNGVYIESAPCNTHRALCALFCFDYIENSWWNRVMYVLIFFRIYAARATIILSSASEITLGDMGKIYPYQARERTIKHEPCTYISGCTVAAEVAFVLRVLFAVFYKTPSWHGSAFCIIGILWGESKFVMYIVALGLNTHCVISVAVTWQR